MAIPFNSTIQPSSINISDHSYQSNSLNSYISHFHALELLICETLASTKSQLLVILLYQNNGFSYSFDISQNYCPKNKKFIYKLMETRIDGAFTKVSGDVIYIEREQIRKYIHPPSMEIDYTKFEALQLIMLLQYWTPNYHLQYNHIQEK